MPNALKDLEFEKIIEEQQKVDLISEKGLFDKPFRLQSKNFNETMDTITYGNPNIKPSPIGENNLFDNVPSNNYSKASHISSTISSLNKRNNRKPNKSIQVLQI